ncbi:MAG: hypothetical protein J6N76_04685 [Lachnospiraceae bacterium]|nr:hypothetical protein [Lachnospiraceae bacterium]
MLGSMQMNMAPVTGPIYDTGQGQAPTIVDTSPNTGMTIARFVMSMDAAMVDIKTKNKEKRESERAKEKEKRVKPVVTSEKDNRIDDRDPYRNPEEIKRKLREQKPEDISEDLFDPLPGGSYDFTA